MASVNFLSTLNRAAIRFSQEASVGVHAGWICRFLSRARNLGWSWRLCKAVEHHVPALVRVAFTQFAERLADFRDASPRAKNAIQVIAVDIVEGEEMFDPVGTLIGGAHAYRPVLPGPRYAAGGADFQWSPLVEADHNSVRRAGAVSPTDQFFYDRNVDRSKSSRCESAAPLAPGGARGVGPTHQ